MTKAEMEAKIEELRLEIRNFQVFLESDKFKGLDETSDTSMLDYAELLRLKAHDMVERSEWGSALIYKIADELEKRSKRQERKDWISTADVQRWLQAIQSIISE